MRKYLFLGLIIKLIIIVFTQHDDLIYTWRIPYLFFPNLNAVGTYYGPLTYITFGILSPVYFISKYVGIWILKIPYLLVDIYILMLLLKLTPKSIHKKVLIFWWINPIVIFSTYALGQLDIIMSATLVLAVALAKKSHVSSMLSLGAGIAYKTMTLPLLIPASLILEKEPFQRAKMLALGVLVPIILTLLFWIFYRSSLSDAYFPSGTIFYPQLSLKPDAIWEYFSLVIGATGYLSAQLLLLKNKIKKVYFPEVLFSSLSFVLIALPLYSLHRYMVLIPLLVLVAVRYQKVKSLTLIIFLLFFGYVYVWRLQWGLVVHLYPQVAHFPALREFTAPLIDYENLAFVFRVIADSLILSLSVLSLKKTFAADK